MKKMLSLLLVLSLMLGCSAAMAEDLGVQIIGGNDAAMETMNLEDVKLGQSYEIGGFARISPVSFEYIDHFAQYTDANVGDNSAATHYGDSNGRVRYAYDDYYEYIYWKTSGKNADFAWLSIDITNMQMSPYAFMKDAKVKVVFNDQYEYAGWVRQINYDYTTTRNTHSDVIDNVETINAVITPAGEEEIGMVYTGHFIFGCTLPNAIVTGKEPLRIEITLGGNEITYNIRK